MFQVLKQGRLVRQKHTPISVSKASSEVLRQIGSLKTQSVSSEERLSTKKKRKAKTTVHRTK